MKNNFFKTTLLVIIGFSFSFITLKQDSSFKNLQIKNARVKLAYQKKWEDLKKLMEQKKIDPQNFNLYLRVFKYEKEFELWAKNTTDTKFQLLKTIPICANSGELGPKRKEGDLQVPEGFYQISAFNPNSNYNLALKVNYPNAADRIKGAGNKLGGDIMVHGECVTIGCIPLQNDPIQEVYILSVEAKNRKQTINIDIFPCRFTKQNWSMLNENYNKDKIDFWTTLNTGYLYFEKNKSVSKITITKKGDYTFEE